MSLVSRPDFLVAGACMDYPAVQAGDVQLVTGETAWRDFTEQSTPAQRSAVLATWRWLSVELLATPSARAKLRHWAVQRRPPLSRTMIDRELIVCGLGSVQRSLLVSALWHLPPPVTRYITTHAWIIGLARHEAGWTWQAPPPRTGPVHLIVLGGDLSDVDLKSVFAHETAHVWLLPAVTHAPPIRARIAAERERTQLALQWGRVDRLVRERQRYERQAAQLARRWGFAGPAADPEFCAARAAVPRFGA